MSSKNMSNSLEHWYKSWTTMYVNWSMAIKGPCTKGTRVEEKMGGEPWLVALTGTRKKQDVGNKSLQFSNSINSQLTAIIRHYILSLGLIFLPCIIVLKYIYCTRSKKIRLSRAPNANTPTIIGPIASNIVQCVWTSCWVLLGVLVVVTRCSFNCYQHSTRCSKASDILGPTMLNADESWMVNF